MTAARSRQEARRPADSRDAGAEAWPGGPAREEGPAVPGPEHASREELLRLAAELPGATARQDRYRRSEGVAAVLDWLETFPGDSWRDRWMLSGADARGRSWAPEGLTPRWRSWLTMGLGTLIVLGAVRPGYEWLFESRHRGLYERYRQRNQSAAFAELARLAGGGHGLGLHEAEVLNVLTRIVLVTGKDLRELSADDLAGYAAARKASGRAAIGVPAAYGLLKSTGGLPGAPATWYQARARGQLTTVELVDRHGLACKPVRDVLVHYLTERSAALDYASLSTQAQMLAGLFWADLERHHPGIDSLRLPPETVHEWKQRIRVRPDGKSRLNFHAILFAVRSFYLDLTQWSLEDPARWAQWAAPCPVSEADISGYAKETRQRRARMADRTRSLVPVLPQLVTAAEQRLAAATRLLQAARDTPPGSEFTVDGCLYLRTGNPPYWAGSPARVFARKADSPRNRIDVQSAEDAAFWTWAAIEVLRRSGVRIEEMLELTHLSLRQYQAPTGEMIPLLQVSPSKTDTERVIPADPELVAVLASIIRRVKNDSGRVPVLSRYDPAERTSGPPLPHLFQATLRRHHHVLTPGWVRNMLKGLAEEAGIADIDGTPLTFTPHDFRRVFSTETVNSGLPIHIAARLLGHLDLNTTQGYVAIYPEEVIRHYRQFIADRRSRRPGEEYREPTDSEWAEFRDHFSLRKVALGTCHRPYGTPCQHEHACVRCPMLRLDPAQVPRLLQIETNTRERLDEARSMKWLGEVAALEESLRYIAEKKNQADRLAAQISRDPSDLA